MNSNTETLAGNPVQIAPDSDQYFTPKPAKNEEEFWDNQALLPGFQGVVVETENNQSTQMLYNYLSTQINFKDETILDAGCGVGRMFPIFINFGAKEVHGVDLSMNMLKVARFKFPQDNVYLYKLNMNNLSIFNDEKFSLVFSCCSLCHIINDEWFHASVKELIRVCATNGTIFICDPMSVTANIHHEHSFMKTRQKEEYNNLFDGLTEIYSAREQFGPAEHIDSFRTVIVYKKR